MIGSYGQVADTLISGAVVEVDALQFSQLNLASLRVAISRAKKTASAAGIGIPRGRILKVTKLPHGGAEISLEEKQSGIQFTVKT